VTVSPGLPADCGGSRLKVSWSVFAGSASAFDSPGDEGKIVINGPTTREKDPQYCWEGGSIF
jgi:hypothetical protein